MDFKHTLAEPSALAALATDALVIVITADGLDAGVDAAVAALVRDAIARGDLSLKPGRTLVLHQPAGLVAKRLVLTVAAADPVATPSAFKAALAAALGALKNGGSKQISVVLGRPGAVGEAHAEAMALAASDASYVYRRTKPSATEGPSFTRIALLCDREAQAAVRRGLARGKAIAAGVTLARECANLPPNVCTPTYLATEAQRLASEYGLEVDVLDRKAVEKLKMGAFLAVAQGSAEPLRFIVARYNGAARTKAPVVIVGKGITFDTGGISIKPSAGMDEMKFDMCGAASVLGTLRAVAELKPRINLVAIIPSCDNMPSGSAVRPGDVVTSMSGQTIEILNTDAEGRLILCDALTYAERFKPAAVVDIATLTGACVVALGHHHSGLFSDDDALAEDLLTASRAAADPAWRMPVDEVYAEGLKSNFADVANVGGREGGAITAAMFLKRFTSSYRWAHLDIAGTAWKSGANKGATGRPVGLLTHFILSQAG